MWTQTALESRQPILESYSTLVVQAVGLFDEDDEYR
jgi:hypothetical protein